MAGAEMSEAPSPGRSPGGPSEKPISTLAGSSTRIENPHGDAGSRYGPAWTRTRDLPIMSALQRLRLFAAVRRFGSLMLFWPLWREPGLRLSPGVRWPRGGPSAPPEHVVRYRETNAARLIRDLAPDGIDLVVEVAAGANAALDLAVLKPHGTIAIYANDGGARLNVDIGTSMGAERAVIS